MTFVYGLTAFISFVFLLAYVTDFKIKNILANHYFLIIFAGFVVRILATRIDMTFQTDIDCFRIWADMLFRDGLSAFYTSDAFTDYPPGYMYVLYLLGFLQSILRLEGPSAIILLKFPAMIFDIAAGIFIYKLALKKAKPSIALFLSFIYLFNPAILINSSVWGQVDSVHTFVIVLSIYKLTEKKYQTAFLLFALLMASNNVILPFHMFFM